MRPADPDSRLEQTDKQMRYTSCLHLVGQSASCFPGVAERGFAGWPGCLKSTQAHSGKMFGPGRSVYRHRAPDTECQSMSLACFFARGPFDYPSPVFVALPLSVQSTIFPA